MMPWKCIGHADNRRLDEWVSVDRLDLRTYEPEEEIGPDGRRALNALRASWRARIAAEPCVYCSGTK